MKQITLIIGGFKSLKHILGMLENLFGVFFSKKRENMSYFVKNENDIYQFLK